jgi:hypothetical protein
MKIFLAAAAIVTSIALHANAQTALSPASDASTSFKSAGDVFKMCTANDKSDLSECLGYMEGITDTQYLLRKADRLPSCFPAGTRNTQIQDAFVTYFMAHPAEREKEGALVIFAAIKARWPCPEK